MVIKREKREKKEKGKTGDRIVTAVLVAVLVAGLVIMLYPPVSSWWNKKVQTSVVNGYEEKVMSMAPEEAEEMIEAAEAYNEALYQVGSFETLSNPEAVSGYYDTLDITGTGIMGYITIDKIDVLLPIYHGTSESVLSAGAGHLEGTSLPVGGENTHCVISSHRGLPGATLFTDLDLLEPGDTFTITIFDRIYTYEVDKISIVLPTEFENLYIEDGQDYVTLMTCTPYGINTHRLLVRGKRAGGVGMNRLIRITSQAYRVDTVIVAIVVAMPILAVLLIWLIITTGRRKNKKE
ncbi:MAG: class C sortase [Clostridiales bacterium]|nr:class C sortase [Clostridiales bacterium]